MKSAFTHYWQREKLNPKKSPHYCTQAFSSQFIERGVSKGDRVFFVSYSGKRPYLVGAITVAASPAELAEGGERIKAVPKSGSVMDFERAIPLDIARRIIRSDTGSGWKFVSPEVMDSQTLRGVQRITPESASLLDSLLGMTGSPFITAGTSIPQTALFPDEISPNAIFAEGSVSRVLVNRYERDPAARKACLAEHGHMCTVCNLDFGAQYGELGEGFIHVHHVKPISDLGNEYQIDPITDLIPVCPNCHAMLHRSDPPLSVKELATIYESAG